MLVAVDLEDEGDGSVLSKVGGVGLQSVSESAQRDVPVGTHQVEDAGGAILLVGMLDEEDETLSGLAGPRSGGVRNLRLLTTKVLSEAGCGDGLLAEPEELLGEAESAASRLARP